MERLRQRWFALTAREKLFVGVGSLAVMLLLIFLSLPSTGTDEAVELARPAAPPPASVYIPPPAPVALSAPAPASTGGLLLKGVLATGAIIAMADGTERVVPIGREFLPGLTLREVGVRHAIIGSAGGDIRIELGRAGGVAAAPVSTAAPGAASVQNQTLELRIGLDARRAGGNVTGYVVKPGAPVALLQRAGLRPGDVLISVNGQAIDGEERLTQIPAELAGASSAEIEYERGGRRMRASVPLR